MSASDRRLHRRIAPDELPEQARVTIPDRPEISLVDLSRGGALLELPFQLPPQARISVQVSTSKEDLTVPFQLLRCYVADVKGSLRYHAAGFFEQPLNWPALLSGSTAPDSPDRLIAVIKELHLRSRMTLERGLSGAAFDKLIGWVLADLRDGQEAGLVSIKFRAHLAQLFPSLVISSASKSALRDTPTSARFFNLDFRSREKLSAADRRLLRAGAQLITLLDSYATRKKTEEAKALGAGKDVPQTMIVHSLAEWLILRESGDIRRAIAC
ncbi:MAG TPA: PilZ domain-containing protein [Vicinamibacterales bacterium]|nr:PilZ domain-containing protein [Vicinamibacterales bacterium]